MDILQKVRGTITREHLFKKGDRIIVGVSGGPDSVTLLHLLNDLRYDLGIRIHVAHLNHGLRKSARQDQQFVESLARKLKLPLTSMKVFIKKTKGKSSLEENAREARFDFFVNLAKKISANCVALGHTRDDLAETVQIGRAHV